MTPSLKTWWQGLNKYFIIGIVLSLGVIIFLIYDVFFVSSSNPFSAVILFFLAILVIGYIISSIVGKFYPNNRFSKKVEKYVEAIFDAFKGF